MLRGDTIDHGASTALPSTRVKENKGTLFPRCFPQLFRHVPLNTRVLGLVLGEGNNGQHNYFTYHVVSDSKHSNFTQQNSWDEPNLHKIIIRGFFSVFPCVAAGRYTPTTP